MDENLKRIGLNPIRLRLIGVIVKRLFDGIRDKTGADGNYSVYHRAVKTGD